MKPDFGESIARGIVGGVVGLLSQPIVIVTFLSSQCRSWFDVRGVGGRSGGTVVVGDEITHQRAACPRGDDFAELGVRYHRPAMVNRRMFLGALGPSLLAAPVVAEEQKAGKVPRVGLLNYEDFWRPLLQQPTELGYIEGRTVQFEYRTSGGQPERLPALAQELVQRRVDTIVTYGTPGSQTAKQATAKIPIVMVGSGDPVKAGLVANLWHPGGNLTGNTILGPDIGAKRLQLLREALPQASRVAFPWNPWKALGGRWAGGTSWRRQRM